MKNLSIVFLTSLVLIFACKKSGNNSVSNNFPGSAETKSQYDNTSFGVYKGVILGSTGTIVIKINNGDNIIKAYLSISGTKDTLSTTQQVVSGQAINNLALTGKISSFSFSAYANGDSVKITNLAITGHPGSIALVTHENSSQQVFCYEGSFTGTQSGNICFIQKGNPYASLTGEILTFFIAKTSDNVLLQGQGLYDRSDTIKYPHYFYSLSSSFEYISGHGKFSGANYDVFSGTWSSYIFPTATGYNGTFSCNRTY